MRIAISSIFICDNAETTTIMESEGEVSAAMPSQFHEVKSDAKSPTRVNLHLKLSHVNLFLYSTVQVTKNSVWLFV
jgi:hypothetical protein